MLRQTGSYMAHPIAVMLFTDRSGRLLITASFAACMSTSLLFDTSAGASPGCRAVVASTGAPDESTYNNSVSWPIARHHSASQVDAETPKN